ncbi:MAG: hypothetical protein LBJ02_05025 [Bifidobacteriaceae bacterium]|nr:hypothetical protein [Bifidobacteriaceae bacterium]
MEQQTRFAGWVLSLLGLAAAMSLGLCVYLAFSSRYLAAAAAALVLAIDLVAMSIAVRRLDAQEGEAAHVAPRRRYGYAVVVMDAALLAAGIAVLVATGEAEFLIYVVVGVGATVAVSLARIRSRGVRLTLGEFFAGL